MQEPAAAENAAGAACESFVSDFERDVELKNW